MGLGIGNGSSSWSERGGVLLPEDSAVAIFGTRPESLRPGVSESLENVIVLVLLVPAPSWIGKQTGDHGNRAGSRQSQDSMVNTRSRTDRNGTLSAAIDSALTW